jgi:flagellin
MQDSDFTDELDPTLYPQSTTNTDTSFVGASPTFRLAEKNVLTGIGTIETADRASDDIAALLERGREIAHQSTQEVLSSRERSFLQDEFLELRKSVALIANKTRFEGIPLADGTMTALELQVGIGNTIKDRMTLELGDLTATALGFFPVGAPPIGLGNTTAAHTAIAVIDLALQSVSHFRSDFSRVQRRIESALGTLHGYTRGLHGVQEIVEDAYHAQVVAQSTRVMMVHHPVVAAQAQASQMHRSTLRLV